MEYKLRLSMTKNLQCFKNKNRSLRSFSSFYNFFKHFKSFQVNLSYSKAIQALFLVACYPTLQPAISVRCSVGRSLGPLYTFSAFLSLLSLLLLPKCSSDLLRHCSCPPARNWGSRVTSVVYKTAACSTVVIGRT